MKLFAALLLIPCALIAQSNMNVFSPVGLVAPGSSGVANIMLNTVSPAAAPAAVQFTVTGTSETGVLTAVAGPAALAAGKQVSCNFTTFLICIVWGLNATPIGNGDIADITVPVLATAKNVTENIGLSGTVGSDPNGVPITEAAVSGILRVFGDCDLNRDGVIDVNDVLVVVTQVIAKGATCTNGDLNRDGKCTVMDAYREILAALPITANITGSGQCRIGL